MISRHGCDGDGLLGALRSAVANLESRVEDVNALNVFPVPDGDTGSNMLATLRAALTDAEAIPVEQRTAGSVAAAVGFGALMGARGNSGVILSQVLRGMADAIDGRRRINALDLAHALDVGSRTAYAAVLRPVEGTILTVVRAAAEAGVAAAEREPEMDVVLAAATEAAELAVARSPSLLPVLREAGVVDAGGEGFFLILQGALRGLVGVAALPASEVPRATGAALIAQGHEGYGYETMFLVTPAAGQLDPDAIRAHLETLGESVLVAGDARAVRIHVHNDRPDRVIGYGLTLGQLGHISVENLDHQAREAREARAAVFTGSAEAVPSQAPPRPATELQPGPAGAGSSGPAPAALASAASAVAPRSASSTAAPGYALAAPGYAAVAPGYATAAPESVPSAPAAGRMAPPGLAASASTSPVSAAPFTGASSPPPGQPAMAAGAGPTSAGSAVAPAAPGDTHAGPGVVAVADGPGLRRIFESFGVAAIVGGGQGDNPSTGELVEAIRRVPAGEVLILPNNRNVRLAAEQAAAMVEERAVLVVPTRNAAEGVAALLALDPGRDAGANLPAMSGAARAVQTLQVANAVRDARIGSHKVKHGQTIVLDPDEGLVAAGNDRTEAVLAAARSLRPGFELLTLYYGDGADLAEAEELSLRLQAAFQGVEVELVHGGQPYYRYLIAAE